MRDFSSQMYEFFLNEMLRTGYKSVSLAEWCEGIRHPKTIVLRHDVDRFPKRSLDFARIENRIGVKSTYYFRYKKNVFVPEIIKEISSLGHEIGYHYEVLSDASGDISKARELFSKNLTAMRKIVPVVTAAMHGRPLSPYREVDFWKNAELSEFALIGEAYVSFQGNAIPYLNDTGRTWQDGTYNLRDKMLPAGLPDKRQNNTLDTSKPPSQKVTSLDKIATTEDLLALLHQGKYSELYLSFHPERWPTGRLAQMIAAAQDAFFNQIKRVLRLLRHVHL